MSKRRKSQADKAFAEFEPILRRLIGWLARRWWGLLLLTCVIAGLLYWLVSPLWAWIILTAGLGVVLLSLIFQRQD